MFPNTIAHYSLSISKPLMLDVFDSFTGPQNEDTAGSSGSVRETAHGTSGTLDSRGHDSGLSRAQEKEAESGGPTSKEEREHTFDNQEWKQYPFLIDQASACRRGECSRTQAVLKGTAHIEAVVGATQETRDGLLSGFLSGLQSRGGPTMPGQDRGGWSNVAGLSSELAQVFKHGGPGGGEGREEKAEEGRGGRDGDESRGEGG